MIFYNCYRHHLDLHSFPTRRSSDLSTPDAPTHMDSMSALSDFLVRRCRPTCGFRTAEKAQELVGGTHTWAGRSEEHTSELQSRLHLVCRLLLEKKKKIQ